MNSALIFKKLVEDVTQMKVQFGSTGNGGPANPKPRPSLGDLLSECRSVFCESTAPDDVVPDEDLRIEACDSQTLPDTPSGGKEIMSANELRGAQLTKGGQERNCFKVLRDKRLTKGSVQCVEARVGMKTKMLIASKEDKEEFPTIDNCFSPKRCSRKRKLDEYSKYTKGGLKIGVCKTRLEKNFYPDARLQFEERSIRNTPNESSVDIKAKTKQALCYDGVTTVPPEGNRQKSLDRSRCEIPLSTLQKKMIKLERGLREQARCSSGNTGTGKESPNTSQSIVGDNDVDLSSKKTLKKMLNRQKCRLFKNQVAIEIPQSNKVSSNNNILNCSESHVQPIKPMTISFDTNENIPKMNGTLVSSRESGLLPAKSSTENTSSFAAIPETHAVNNKTCLVTEPAPTSATKISDFKNDEPIKSNTSEVTDHAAARVHSLPRGHSGEEKMAALTSPVLRTRIARRTRSWAKRSSLTTLGWNKGLVSPTLPGACPAKSTLPVFPEPIKGLRCSSLAEDAVASKDCFGEGTNEDSSNIQASACPSGAASTVTDNKTLRDTREVQPTPCGHLDNAVEGGECVTVDAALDNKVLSDLFLASMSTPTPGHSKAPKKRMKDISEICETDCNMQRDLSLSPLFDSDPYFGVSSGNEIPEVLGMCHPINLDDAMLATGPASPVLSKGRQGYLSAPVSLLRRSSCQTTSRKRAASTGSPILGSGSLKLNNSCSGRFTSCQAGSVDAKRCLFNTALCNDPTEKKEESHVLIPTNSLDDTDSIIECSNGVTTEQKGNKLVCELGTLASFPFSGRGEYFSIANSETELLSLEDLFKDTSPPHNCHQDFEIDETNTQYLDRDGLRPVEVHDSQQLIIEVNTQPHSTSQSFPSSQLLVTSNALSRIPKSSVPRTTPQCPVETDTLTGSEVELCVAEAESETEQEICEADDSESGTPDVSCSSCEVLLRSTTACRDSGCGVGPSQCLSPQLSIGSVSPLSEELEHISCNSPSLPSLPSPLTTITTYGPHPLAACDVTGLKDGPHISINELTNRVQHPSPVPHPPLAPRLSPNADMPRPLPVCTVPKAYMLRSVDIRSSPSLQHQRVTSYRDNGSALHIEDEGRSPSGGNDAKAPTTELDINIELSGETEPKASNRRGSVRPLNPLKQGRPLYQTNNSIHEVALTPSAYSINEYTIVSDTDASHVSKSKNTKICERGEPSSISFIDHDAVAISSSSCREYSRGCEQHINETANKEAVLYVTNLTSIINDCSDCHNDSIIDPTCGVDEENNTLTAVAGITKRLKDITRTETNNAAEVAGGADPAPPEHPAHHVGPVTVREWVLQLQRTPQKRQQGVVSCAPQQQTPESASKRIRRDGLAARLQRALAVWQSDDVIRRHQTAGNHTTRRVAATDAITGSSAKDQRGRLSSCITAGDNATALGCNVPYPSIGNPTASYYPDNNLLLDAKSTGQEPAFTLTTKRKPPVQSCTPCEFQTPLPLKRLFQRQFYSSTTSGPSPKILRHNQGTAGIVNTRPPAVKYIQQSLSCGVEDNVFQNSEAAPIAFNKSISKPHHSKVLGESSSRQSGTPSTEAAVTTAYSRTPVRLVKALKSCPPTRDYDLQNVPFSTSKTATVTDASKTSKKTVKTLDIIIEGVGSLLEPLPPNAARARLLNTDDEEDRSCSIATGNDRNINCVQAQDCSKTQEMTEAVSCITDARYLDDALVGKRSGGTTGYDRSRINEEEINGKCDVAAALPCRPSVVLVFFLMSLSKRLQPGDAFTILPPWQQLVLSGPPRRVLFVSHCAQTPPPARL